MAVPPTADEATAGSLPPLAEPAAGSLSPLAEPAAGSLSPLAEPAAVEPARASRGVTALVALLVLLTVAISFAPTLANGGLLLRSDVVFNHAPWSEQPPDGWTAGVSGTDPVDTGFPSQRQFYDRLRDGDFATWNPLVAGGAPLGSVSHIGPFDPLNLLPWLLLGEQAVPLASKLLEVALAIAGMALLLRRLGTSTAVGLVGGLIYAFSGFQTAWTNWPQGHVGAWIPLLFFAAEGVLRAQRSTGRSARKGLLLVGCVLAMALGGFPSVLGYALVALTGYLAVRLVAGQWEGRRAGLRSEGRAEQAERQTEGATSSASALGQLRPLARHVLAGLWRPVGLMVVGIGLAAWQLAPALAQLRAVDTGYRGEWPYDAALMAKTAFTLVFPNLFGSYELGFVDADVTYFDFQSFLGGAALVLVVVAMVRWRRQLREGIGMGGVAGGAPAGAFGALTTIAALSGLLVFVGGPALWLVNQLPLLGGHRIDRLRSLLLFALAVLAALGLSALVDRRTPRHGRGPASTLAGRLKWPSNRKVRQVLLGTLATAALVVLAWVATRALGTAAEFDKRAQVAVVLLVGLAAIGATAALVWMVTRRRDPGGDDGCRWRTIGLLGVAVVVSIEVALFATPFLPATDPEHHYLATRSHEFLTAEENAGRVATHFLTLYPGTTAYYGIPTVSGHTFHWPTWAEMLEQLSPGALDNNATFSVLDLSHPDTWQSPLLDRLAVRWVVNRTDQPVSGRYVNPHPTADQTGANSGTVLLAAGATVVRRVPAQPVRGIELQLAEPFTTDDPAAHLRVDVTDPDGRRHTGWRGVANGLPAGVHGVPVAAEEAGDGVADAADADQAEMTVAVTLVAQDGHLKLRTDAEGTLALLVAQPIDDGLRLAQTSATVIWENRNALDRFRFASQALVIGDRSERLRTLAGALPADTVVLSEQPPDGWPATPSSDATTDASGSPGDITRIDDQLDHLTVDVSAPANGYLVVADALQHGWHATVNGEPVPLLAADHALVAVPVPAGNSTVELTHQPPGLGVGVATSAVAGCVGLAALLWRPTRRRLARRLT